MDRITQESDGSYRWSCSIDPAFHRDSVKSGLRVCIWAAVFLLVIAVLICAANHAWDSLWIAVLPIGVFLGLTLVLTGLSASATDPHEQYVMTGKYIRSGYGKSAVFSDYTKTKILTITSEYIELQGKHGRSNRIYVPHEDMDFVRNYITERIPESTLIRHR